MPSKMGVKAPSRIIARSTLHSPSFQHVCWSQRRLEKAVALPIRVPYSRHRCLSLEKVTTAYPVVFFLFSRSVWHDFFSSSVSWSW
jgi:hypothetical protein